MSRSDPFRNKSLRRGASVVELALIAPVFFLLVFSIMEFSRAVMVQQSLTDAARAAARTAALASTINVSTAESAARDYLRQTMTSSFDMSQCQINISPSGLSNLATGTEITARVMLNYDDVSWVMPRYVNGIVLRGEARMTRE